MVLPVRGFLPLRAGRFCIEKVPKPMIAILPPFFISALVTSRRALKVFAAAALVISAFLAIAATNSVLFIIMKLRVKQLF